MKHKNILTIDLTRRLPDTHILPKEYWDYGRFAILRDNSLWFSRWQSSHPLNTLTGYYWGLNRNTLYISSRGCQLDKERDITDFVIKWLVGKIGIKKYYSHFKKIT